MSKRDESGGAKKTSQQDAMDINLRAMNPLWPLRRAAPTTAESAPHLSLRIAKLSFQKKDTQLFGAKFTRFISHYDDLTIACANFPTTTRE